MKKKYNQKFTFLKQKNAPLDANITAVSLPIPDVAPVIMTTLPSNRSLQLQ